MLLIYGVLISMAYTLFSLKFNVSNNLSSSDMIKLFLYGGLFKTTIVVDLGSLRDTICNQFADR